MPRFGLRREEIEELLGLAALRARQAQYGWQLASSLNPNDVAQAEGALAGINAQIATLEAIAEVIERNNQQLLSDLQRLLGVTRRPTGPPPPRVVSAPEAAASATSGGSALTPVEAGAAQAPDGEAPNPAGSAAASPERGESSTSRQ